MNSVHQRSGVRSPLSEALDASKWSLENELPLSLSWNRKSWDPKHPVLPIALGLPPQPKIRIKNKDSRLQMIQLPFSGQLTAICTKLFALLLHFSGLSPLGSLQFSSRSLFQVESTKYSRIFVWFEIWNCLKSVENGMCYPGRLLGKENCFRRQPMPDDSDEFKLLI